MFFGFFLCAGEKNEATLGDLILLTSMPPFSFLSSFPSRATKPPIPALPLQS